MLPPIAKRLPCSNSRASLVACRDAPTVTASVLVRSIVPYGTKAQVLPAPGGQGIGLLFWSRITNWLRNEVVIGLGRGDPAPSRQSRCGNDEALLQRSTSAPLPSRCACRKLRT